MFKAKLAILVVLALPQVGSTDVVTHLFTDWSKVDAGNTIFPVDMSQVSDMHRELIGKVQDYYQKTMHLADGPRAPKRIHAASGVRISIEKAKRVGPWLKAEKPWEKGSLHVSTVLQDGDLYRMWYTCEWTLRNEALVLPSGRVKLGSKEGGSATCYAESADGFHWDRPSLGLVEYKGSRDNNIISMGKTAGIGGPVFLDPNAPPEERFKMVRLANMRTFYPDAKEVYGLLGAAVSPDGVKWRRLPDPLWEQYYNSDGTPSIYFDQKLKKYVLYTRQNYPRRRSIARAETADFTHWPHPTLILTPGPQEKPSDDFYTNTYLSYPGAENCHLLLVSIYHRDSSLVDMRMANSSDGIAWNWLSQEPIVELGKPFDWDGGSMYASPSLIRLPDRRVAVPISGFGWSHNEWWRVRFHKRKWLKGVGYAIWEDGRLAGIEAAQQGEFTTMPFTFQGKDVEVNVRTHGNTGSVGLEMIVGGPLRSESEPGPTIKAQDIVGDHVWVPVSWEGAADLPSHAGKTVRLRFRLFNAKVFGFRSVGMTQLDQLTRPPGPR